LLSGHLEGLLMLLQVRSIERLCLISGRLLEIRLRFLRLA
jgi:hypothetical protein